MSKKTLRVAAVLVSLCFILAIAPVLNSAEKRPVKTSTSILSLLKKPFFLLGSLLNLYPYPPVLYDNGSIRGASVIPGTGNATTGFIKKTTDDQPSMPPPTHKD